MVLGVIQVSSVPGTFQTFFFIILALAKADSKISNGTLIIPLKETAVKNKFEFVHAKRMTITNFSNVFCYYIKNVIAVNAFR